MSSPILRTRPPTSGSPADGLPAPIAASLRGASGVWVFAYGSLLWRTDFRPAELQLARVHGWHRALSVYAVGGRGTPAVPGLFFGLERGGSVAGLALRLGGPHWRLVLARLWRREMPDDAYRPAWVTCELPGERRVRALAFVANRSSPLHAGRLALPATLRLVRQGRGALGTSVSYVLRTAHQLAALGIVDRRLCRTARALSEPGASPGSAHQTGTV